MYIAKNKVPYLLLLYFCINACKSIKNAYSLSMASASYVSVRLKIKSWINLSNT